MSENRKSNKNSASEDELGEIHKLTTTLHAIRLRTMVAAIKSGIDVEAVIGDGKALQAAGKWAADQNNITASQPEMDEETELAKQLAVIKKAQEGKGASPTTTPYDDGLH